jgi:sterol desaturase/sphingolipid hydroxylase (fatty acid hydroxylase superfamily)
MELNHFWNIITTSYTGAWNYFWFQITHPNWHNYFYWLIGISLAVTILEFKFPWRKEQKIFRNDFWLDIFYLFFNFFFFSIIIYAALSNIVVDFYTQILGGFGMKNQVAFHFEKLPILLQFILMFILKDFIQWNIHRLLHKVPILWKFHKVHHSTQFMSWLGHFRFHWMESIIYKTLEYIPIAFFGFSIEDFFILHIIAISIGHLNHANLSWTYGPFKYIFNNPVMHLWHHALEVPDGKTGVNFGLSLSIWDYLFKTAHIPHSSSNIPLGFEGIDEYPKTGFDQMKAPFR